MTTILVTGKNSQLSQCLQDIEKVHSSFNFIFKDSRSLDITNSNQLELFFNNNTIDYCINCAAYTAVDKAEEEEGNALRVNVEGVKNLINSCNKNNIILIHISTDFVFNGHSKNPYIETDKTGPLGVYGFTKLKGELEISKNLKEHFIIRTSWLYSEYGNNFLKTMLRLSKEKEEISVVDDQTGSPTYAKDLAGVIIKFIETKSKRFGIYHYSNKEEVSWYDFAKAIFKISNIGIKLNPIPTNEYPTPAERPRYSVLNTDKIKKELRIDIPNWKKSLKKAITNLNEQ